MVTIRIPSEQAISRINDRIAALDTVNRNEYGLEYYDFIRWCSATWQVIDAIYGSDDPHAEEMRTLSLANCSCNAGTQAAILADAYRDRLHAFADEIRTSLPADH